MRTLFMRSGGWFAGLLFSMICIGGSVTSCRNQEPPEAKHVPQETQQLSSEERTVPDTPTNTLIAPTFEHEISEGKNILWSATLQLAWDELHRFADGTIKMEGDPGLVDLLNHQTIKKADLSLDSEDYIAVAGLISDEFLQKVQQTVPETLAEQALADLGTLPQHSLAAYAYLVKELPFEWAFRRFEQPLQFQGDDVAAFGLKQYLASNPKDQKLAEQVVVLDYQSDQNYILELLTTSSADRLILANIAPAATLKATVNHVMERIEQATPSRLQNLESVIIPVITVERTKNYPELCGRKIQAENVDLNGLALSTVMQRIRFTLDETGASLESKTMAFSARSLRQFIFDKPFLVFLIRQDALVPYFVLWIENAELLTLLQ